MSHSVCVFWDNSNIFIGAQWIAAEKEGPLTHPKSLRVHFGQLYDLAVGGRPVRSAVCVGSVPPELDEVWKRLRETGVAVELFERGAGSGTEQAVDQALQVHMLRAMVDVTPPGVAVLLTGDGAGFESGVGFHADLARMRKLGWGIEVLSWNKTCNSKLKTWAASEGVFVSLDDWYEDITFAKGGRSSRRSGHIKRPYAAPIAGN